MGSNSVFLSEKFTERTLIESILASHFIIDYGFIKKVNDNKTVDVTHAKQPKTLDGRTLPATVTTGVEVLTIAGGGFSFKFDYKKGDKVLLLGLKNFIPKVEEVTSATETTAYLHYSRETLKALPLCVFNGDAKVTVQVESGTMKVDTQEKIELNGNDKQFVTYAELDDALQELWGKIKNHTHSVSTSGSATAQTGTAAASSDLAGASLDISAAKTTTVVTGG